MPTYLFTGQSLKNQHTIFRPGELPETLHPYLPDDDLVRAVNVSLYLKRPLLLMGEPGSGKSQLARVLAYELYNETDTSFEPTDNDAYVQIEGGTKKFLKRDYRQYFQEWNINSNAKAREGLYEYDAIQRLGEAQLLTRVGDQTALEKKKYITYGPLGRAIRNSTKESRVVLLIDEIDKADLDFSNDLLNELDKSSFTVIETDEKITAKAYPIVIITSNGEKELPDAFLRRCVFYRINPFDKDKLTDIIRRRFFSSKPAQTSGNKKTSSANKISETLITDATTRFIAVREKINDNRVSTGSKSVSTAEFLDWFGVLKYYRELKAANDTDKSMKKEADKLDQKFPIVPFRQALLKHASMLNLFPDPADGKSK